MTGRISIPALREWARSDVWDDYGEGASNTLLALVEAVEAAQAYRDAEDEGQSYDRMSDALARFDFGEET